MSKSKRPERPEPSQRPTWLLPTIIIGAVAVVMAIAAVIIGSRGAPFEPEVTGAARAEIEETSIDHGTLRFEQPVESVFRVRNVGDQPLLILGEPRVELVEGC